jgi:hypothetical protein
MATRIGTWQLRHRYICDLGWESACWLGLVQVYSSRDGERGRLLVLVAVAAVIICQHSPVVMLGSGLRRKRFSEARDWSLCVRVMAVEAGEPARGRPQMQAMSVLLRCVIGILCGAGRAWLR